MQSHHYRFHLSQVMRLFVPPLTALLLFALIVHRGTWAGLLPRPRPSENVDETVLVHQVDASRHASETDLLLLGDSSCLMDVQAEALSDQLGRNCLNLGTFSDLDLQAAGWLLREFARANPNRPQAVLVLMHPEALRRAGGEERPTQFLRSYLDNRSPRPPATRLGQLHDLLGLHEFRCRVRDRCLPVPLPGPYGRFYGFTRDLERHLTRHHGSAVDPTPKPFGGNAEYRLAPSWETASDTFQKEVPPFSRLLIGITPIPESHAPPDYEDRYLKMLDKWAQSMSRASPLRTLPPTLPDAHFVSVTHLNPAASVDYTLRLAKLIEQESPPN